MNVRERTAGRTRAIGMLVPGVGGAAVVAGAAWLLAQVLPGPIGAVSLAVLLGLVAGQLLPREPLASGIGFVTRRVLRLGIVLLGARLSLVEVAELGAVSVALVVGTLAVGFATAWYVGRAVGLSRELSALLGIGSAICGNTAIMATAPVIRARERDVGLAVATITLCGTVALLVYPSIGRVLGMDDVAFGMWAGLAVQDTSQVVATGAAFSEEARDVATVVKLVRNTFLAVLLPLIAWAWRRQPGIEASTTGAAGIRKAFPTFVLGFLGMAALRSVGIIGEDLGEGLGQAASLAILLAVAGLGLSVHLRDLARTSVRSVAVGALAAAVLGAGALVAAVLVGPTLAP